MQFTWKNTEVYYAVSLCYFAALNAVSLGIFGVCATASFFGITSTQCGGVRALSLTYVDKIVHPVYKLASSVTVSIRKNPEKERTEAPATDSDESIKKVPPSRPPPPSLAHSSSTQPLLAAADADDDEEEEENRSEGENYSMYSTAVVPHSLAGKASLVPSHLL